MGSSGRAAAAALVIGCGALCSGEAAAADSSLQLIIGGEAYDGAPRVEVSFDVKVIGEATVAAAIDTVADGRFADAADKAAHVESVSLPIPEAVFKPGGVVRVRFINEAYGGEGSNHDRNVYLAAVAVNGRAVTLSGLTTQGTKANTPNQTLGEFLVLADGTVEAVSRPPTGGWPQPGSEPLAVASTASAGTAPAIAARLQVPTAPDPVETASTAKAATPVGTACSGDTLYNVIGFNENSNALTDRLRTRLDQLVADIGTQQCKVQVTGYSSRQGDHATNALFAVERAQNVLAYLKDKGLDFAEASATGGGATDQFGPDFADNRRVVVTVRP